jgi:hypothetical protein
MSFGNQDVTGYNRYHKSYKQQYNVIEFVINVYLKSKGEKESL